MSFSGQTYTIGAGEHQATVREVAAALQSYRHARRDVTVAYDDSVIPPKACGITLVPWPNRIRGGRYDFEGTSYQLALTEPAKGNASHGLGRWERWDLVERSDEHVVLRLDIVPQNGYPFELRVDVTYRLDAERGLTVTTVAGNVGHAKAPFGAGAHPYLSTLGHPLDEVTVHLAAAKVLVTDDAQVPVGRKSVGRTPFDLRKGKRLRGHRFDDAFAEIARDDEGRGIAEIVTKSGGARVWFADTYRYAQLFTVDQLTEQGAGIAVEPMTCPADAFNSGAGLIVLEPGASWTGSWGIQPT